MAIDPVTAKIMARLAAQAVTDMRNTIIQIRQSGIRVKRPTYYPSLVAMLNTPKKRMGW